jgi:hypothetical protein
LQGGGFGLGGGGQFAFHPQAFGLALALAFIGLGLERGLLQRLTLALGLGALGPAAAEPAGALAFPEARAAPPFPPKALMMSDTLRGEGGGGDQGRGEWRRSWQSTQCG